MYYLGVDGGGTKTTAVLLDTTIGELRSVRPGIGNVVILGQAGCEKLRDELRLLIVYPCGSGTDILG